MLIAENSSFDIEHLKVMLAQRFHMKDLGPVSYFLGLEISRSHDGFFYLPETLYHGSFTRIWHDLCHTPKTPCELSLQIDIHHWHPTARSPSLPTIN